MLGQYVSFHECMKETHNNTQYDDKDKLDEIYKYSKKLSLWIEKHLPKHHEDAKKNDCSYNSFVENLIDDLKEQLEQLKRYSNYISDNTVKYVVPDAPTDTPEDIEKIYKTPEDIEKIEEINTWKWIYRIKELIQIAKIDHYLINRGSEELPKSIQDDINLILDSRYLSKRCYYYRNRTYAFQSYEDEPFYKAYIALIIFDSINNNNTYLELIDLSHLKDFAIHCLIEIRDGSCSSDFVPKDGALAPKYNIKNSLIPLAMAAYRAKESNTEVNPNPESTLATAKHLKLDHIKKQIENDLVYADHFNISTPFPVGLAGSSSIIRHNNRNFIVPRGIKQIYLLVSSYSLDNQSIENAYNNVEKILIQKTQNLSCKHRLFRQLTGRNRSKETQEKYTNLKKYCINDGSIEFIANLEKNPAPQIRFG